AVLVHVDAEAPLRALRDTAIGTLGKESCEHRSQLAVDPSPRRAIRRFVAGLEQHGVLTAPGPGAAARHRERGPIHFEAEHARGLLGVAAEPDAEEWAPAFERTGDGNQERD